MLFDKKAQLPAQPVEATKALAFCDPLIHLLVAQMFLAGSLVVDGPIQDAAAEIFVGLYDYEVVVVAKRLGGTPLAWRKVAQCWAKVSESASLELSLKGGHCNFQLLYFAFRGYPVALDVEAWDVGVFLTLGLIDFWWG